MATTSLKIAATPLNIWRHLKTHGGLEVRRGKGKPGRDHDLEVEILSELAKRCGIAASRNSLDQILVADQRTPLPSIGAEQFLTAVLAATGPFAMMMRGIMEVLQLADAKQGEHSLTFDFQFDELDDPLRFTLEQFREVVERVDTVEKRRYEFPNSNTLWLIHSILAEEVKSRMQAQPRLSYLTPPKACPHSGNVRLDAVLQQVHELVSELLNWALGIGKGRTEPFRRISAPDPSTIMAGQRDVAVALTDYWDTSVLDLIAQIARDAKAGLINADLVADRLEQELPNIPRRSEWVSETIRELLDVLNLPAWKKRHELFSVWVGTVLLQCAYRSSEQIRFHPENGVLSFSFAGAKLATYTARGNEFEIWCEMRSDLTRKTSRKRKKGIQPDFRVVDARIWDRNQGTSLVIECKHYLQQVVSNFAEAVNDYAHSCSHAQVVLANYGPIDNARLMSAVEPALKARVSFIGDATPVEEEKHRQVTNAIQSVLFPPISTLVGTHYTAATGHLHGRVGRIRLVWERQLADMDLSLAITCSEPPAEYEVNFSRQGSLQAPPYAQLDKDVRSGPGEEVIAVSQWYGDKYDVFVHDYSETGRMQASQLHCEITIGGKLTRIPFPAGVLGGVRWHVATIDARTELIMPINTVSGDSALASPVPS